MFVQILQGNVPNVHFPVLSRPKKQNFDSPAKNPCDNGPPQVGTWQLNCASKVNWGAEEKDAPGSCLCHQATGEEPEDICRAHILGTRICMASSQPVMYV